MNEKKTNKQNKQINTILQSQQLSTNQIANDLKNNNKKRSAGLFYVENDTKGTVLGCVESRIEKKTEHTDSFTHIHR